ncbi:hypothetical protein GE061_003880 [Apolygus lucorum]|uniref:PABC domain-containing protein n=1 Tax=Apolygus lucorum TaxID=248454 RepID=A0A8S9WZ47_APOLU|nr:hypothetical protein GE061_003880 [Apolygus lucorum]
MLVPSDNSKSNSAIFSPDVLWKLGNVNIKLRHRQKRLAITERTQNFTSLAPSNDTHIFGHFVNILLLSLLASFRALYRNTFIASYLITQWLQWNVLVEHLTAKVAPLFTSKYRAVETVLEISGKLQNKDIIQLLEDEGKLIQAVSHSSWYRREKEDLGEELFCKVSEIEPDLSSKITGMLLELDNQTIRQLFKSEDLLVKAVEKSKEEYLTYEEETEIKEAIGEELYNRVLNHYPPEVASPERVEL